MVAAFRLFHQGIDSLGAWKRCHGIPIRSRRARSARSKRTRNAHDKPQDAADRDNQARGDSKVIHGALLGDRVHAAAFPL
jgi:hypothetical protein